MSDGGKSSSETIRPNLISISMEISTFMVYLSIFNWFKIRIFSEKKFINT